MLNDLNEEIQSYYIDIEIACAAIKEALLYPDREILFDLYAIPSHNHQAFYTIIYEKDNYYEMVYAKTEIYTVKYEVPIKMYPFSDAKNAAKQPHSDGRIIVGIAIPDEEFIKSLMEMVSSVEGINPDKKGLVLDGVFQAIRVFDKGKIDKEIIYHDSDNILLSDNADSRDFLDNMYLYVEKMISYGD